MKNNGFVLAEFVIALPLLILLLFALGEITYKIFSTMYNQAADYILETEAHEVLEQISTEAKAAHSAEIKQAIGGKDIQEIFFNYHVVGNNLSKDYFKKSDFNSSTADIVDLIYTRRFTVGATETGGYHVYAERMENGPKKNPISGGNVLGDTTVTKLKFTSTKKLLHIELEMQSVVTDKKIKVATSVFMPACEEMKP